MHFVFECACILDDFHLDQSQFSGPVPEKIGHPNLLMAVLIWCVGASWSLPCHLNFTETYSGSAAWIDNGAQQLLVQRLWHRCSSVKKRDKVEGRNLEIHQDQRSNSHPSSQRGQGCLATGETDWILLSGTWRQMILNLTNEPQKIRGLRCILPKLTLWRAPVPPGAARFGTTGLAINRMRIINLNHCQSFQVQTHHSAGLYGGKSQVCTLNPLLASGGYHMGGAMWHIALKTTIATSSKDWGDTTMAFLNRSPQKSQCDEPGLSFGLRQWLNSGYHIYDMVLSMFYHIVALHSTA